MLLELMLDFHAWSSARPMHESDKTADALIRFAQHTLRNLTVRLDPLAKWGSTRKYSIEVQAQGDAHSMTVVASFYWQ